MVEDVESRAKTNRQSLNALNKTIFDGKVKTVLVWKLDRIARTQRDGINTLHEWCEAGVCVVSITQQIDLSGTVGRIVAGVLSVLWKLVSGVNEILNGRSLIR